MRRWGQVGENKPDSWYHDLAKKVYKPAIYLEAARLLVEDGLAEAKDFPFETDGYREPQTHFIDNKVYNGRKPNEYIDNFTIGLK